MAGRREKDKTPRRQQHICFQLHQQRRDAYLHHISPLATHLSGPLCQLGVWHQLRHSPDIPRQLAWDAEREKGVGKKGGGERGREMKIEKEGRRRKGGREGGREGGAEKAASRTQTGHQSHPLATLAGVNAMRKARRDRG